MHHPDSAAPAPGGFLLQNPCVDDNAALLFLAGGIGLPAGAGPKAALEPSLDTPAATPASLQPFISERPSPPPRA